MIRGLKLAVLGLAAAAPSALASGTIHIQGTTWGDTNWATTDYATGSGGTGSGAQTTVGNPDPGRLVTHAMNPGASELFVFHRKTTADAIIDPADFEIASISFSIDARFQSGVGATGQRVGLALRQSGIDYRTGWVTTGVDTVHWVTKTASFSPADFVRLDGLAGSPDFSPSGANLRFGFFTANSNTAGSGGFAQRCNYDNLDIVVYGSQLITETEWADADWSATDFTTGSGGAGSAARSIADGRPAPGRLVTHAMSAGAGSLNVFHKNLKPRAVVDLGGAPVRIASIDFSIDAQYVSGVGGNGHALGLAIEQDGVAYRTTGLTTGSSGSWVSRSDTYTAADFARMDGLPGAPNFSSTGSPITVGFRTANTNGAGSGPFSQRVNYDNFVARINLLCMADLNADGQVDFADYLEFLNLYDAQDPAVDFNGDGQVDFSDYLEFLNFYDAAC